MSACGIDDSDLRELLLEGPMLGVLVSEPWLVLVAVGADEFS